MNREELLKKYKAIKERKSINSDTSDTNKFRPKEGDFLFRLLEDENGSPVEEYQWHWNIEGKNYLCNQSFGQDCAICRTASDIWRDYQETVSDNNPDEDLKELAISMFSDKRYYSPILLRGQEEQGPMIYSYGVTVVEQIFDLIVQPETGEKFLSTDKGHDMKLSYKYKVPNNKRTAVSKISPNMAITDFLPEDCALSKEDVLEAVPNLKELFEPSKEEDLLAALDSLIGSLEGTTEEETAEGMELYGGGPAPFDGDDDEDEDMNPVQKAMSELKKAN